MRDSDFNLSLSRRSVGQLIAGSVAAGAVSQKLKAKPTSGSLPAVTVEAKPEAFKLRPSSAAVIVVDMQNDFGSKGGALSGPESTSEVSRQLCRASPRCLRPHDEPASP